MVSGNEAAGDGGGVHALGASALVVTSGDNGDGDAMALEARRRADAAGVVIVDNVAGGRGGGLFLGGGAALLQAMARDVAHGGAVPASAKNGSDLAEDVLGAVKNGSVKFFIIKVFVLSIVKARAKPLRC